MIYETYCSYEVATLLKEKGFDIGCYGRYSTHSKEFHFDATRKCENHGLFIIAAPTHQMAMKWLREVHHIHTEICLYKTNENDVEPKKNRKTSYYTFGVWDSVTGNNIDKRLTNDFIGDTYEEACEAALKYVLEKLI